ncbi:MAG: integrase/recombinase XerD [Bacteroidetes bacterium]|nr:MAG: integrase/recombinase XerD [Bacteroidota bacterium]
MAKQIVITLRSVTYQGEKRIAAEFDYNPEFIGLLKMIPGCSWSRSLRVWHMPDSKESLDYLFGTFRGKAWLDLESLKRSKSEASVQAKPVFQHPKIRLPDLTREAAEKLERLSQWMLSKRYSENSIRIYTDCLRTFLRYFNEKSTEDITNDAIIQFNNDYILANRYSSSYQNQVVNAIKLFCRVVEQRHLDPELIHRPKNYKKLPNVLSKEEVTSILKAAEPNLKHQAMLALIYSCGLRRSEMINLTLNDVDSKRGLLLVKNSKGKKDRVIPLSSRIVDLLRAYYNRYRTETWLFEGWEKGEKYSDRSLEEVLKKYTKLAGITKPVTLHWLRHSYATHLLENGTDLRFIQEILGHKSSKTTEIYTHVSTRHIQQIKSPFDDLEL